MDLLIATSEREPFGRTLIEAMAVGTPVIAAGVAGHLEIVDHERTGLLVSPNDAGAFAEAAHRILTDHQIAARLAKAGRERAVETVFGGTSCGSNHFGLWECVCSEATSVTPQ